MALRGRNGFVPPFRIITRFVQILTFVRAVILAGGYGKRIMPLTHYKCKPMLPVANRPALDYAVSRLRAAGIRDITFALGYKPYDVVDFAEGYTDINVSYSVEDEPLGTAGAVKLAAGGCDDDIVVCSADTLDDCDLTDMLELHKRSGAIATIETTEVEDLGPYGEVIADGGRVLGLREKLPENAGRRGIANTGTYVLSARALGYVPAGVPFDFAKDLFPYLLKLGRLICEVRSRGYWRDIGSLSDYYAANFDMKRGYPFPAAKHLSRPYCMSVNGNLVAESARVCGRIRNCIIGEGAIVASSAKLESCVVLPGEVVTGSGCGCVIGRDFSLDPLLSGVNLKNAHDTSNIFRLFTSINL